MRIRFATTMTGHATRPFRFIVGVSILTSLAVAPQLLHPSEAHAAVRKDGNDTQGALDLASVSIEVSKKGITYTFKTLKGFTALTLAPSSYFLAAMDRNMDGSADRCAFIYEAGSRFQGQLTNCGKKALDTLPVKHPSSNQVAISMDPLSATYRWRAFSVYQQRPNCGGSDACVDAVPNRGTMLQDLTSPTVEWVTGQPSPALSTTMSLTTTIPVDFQAQDDRKVASWAIRRTENTPLLTWETVTTGTGEGSVHVDLAAEQGQRYNMKVFAKDAQGNTGETPTYLDFVVPFDDTNAIMQYSGTWSNTSDAGSLLGSHATSSAVGSSVTFTVTHGWNGGQVFVMGGPGNGTATFCEGATCEALSETAGTPAVSYVGPSFYSGTSGPATFTVTVTSGTFNVDGIVVTG
jgi:hypothetical protein